jgi:hypothetical protein
VKARDSHSRRNAKQSGPNRAAPAGEPGTRRADPAQEKLRSPWAPVLVPPSSPASHGAASAAAEADVGGAGAPRQYAGEGNDGAPRIFVRLHRDVSPPPRAPLPPPPAPHRRASRRRTASALEPSIPSALMHRRAPH